MAMSTCNDVIVSSFIAALSLPSQYPPLTSRTATLLEVYKGAPFDSWTTARLHHHRNPDPAAAISKCGECDVSH